MSSANILARCTPTLAKIALFAAAVVLAGCSSPSRVGVTDVSCDIIDGKAFSDLFEQPPENLALYLENAFTTTIEVESQPITTTSGVVQESFYLWNSGIGTYLLSTFDFHSRFVRLGFADKKSPALERVIECLGAPIYYSMRYTSTGDSLPFVVGEFFYIDKGTIVSVLLWGPEINGAGSQHDPIHAIQNSTPVRTIQWVEPHHDVETMDWLAVIDDWRPDEMSHLAFTQLRLDYYRTFRPWPGGIDKMELTYVEAYLLPALTDESPLQPTATP